MKGTWLVLKFIETFILRCPEYESQLLYPLSVYPAPPTCQTFQLSCEIFQHLADGLAQIIAKTSMFSRRKNNDDFGDPLTFPLAPE